MKYFIPLQKSYVDSQRLILDSSPQIKFHPSSHNDLSSITLPDYRHWEYHSFCLVQVYGLAHVVAPVQPLPPHCANWGAPVLLEPAVVVVLVAVVVEPEPEPEPEPELPELKVEPRGPTLMLE